MSTTEYQSRNEMTVRGDPAEIEQVFQRVGNLQATGWRRDSEAELRRRRRMGLAGWEGYCFDCVAAGARPAAALWLHRRGPNSLATSTIMPLTKRVLSARDHNVILNDFDLAILRPASAGLRVELNMHPHQVPLEASLSSEAIRRLNAFGSAANKISFQGGDSTRWQQFIVQLHLDGSDFDLQMLEKVLSEQGWTNEECKRLIREYETTRTLLRAYDEERLEQCLP